MYNKYIIGIPVSLVTSTENQVENMSFSVGVWLPSFRVPIFSHGRVPSTRLLVTILLFPHWVLHELPQREMSITRTTYKIPLQSYKRGALKERSVYIVVLTRSRTQETQRASWIRDL
jgi:hypothetical protein